MLGFDVYQSCRGPQSTPCLLWDSAGLCLGPAQESWKPWGPQARCTCVILTEQGDDLEKLLGEWSGACLPLSSELWLP